MQDSLLGFRSMIGRNSTLDVVNTWEKEDVALRMKPVQCGLGMSLSRAKKQPQCHKRLRKEKEESTTLTSSECKGVSTSLWCSCFADLMYEMILIPRSVNNDADDGRFCRRGSLRACVLELFRTEIFHLPWKVPFTVSVITLSPTHWTKVSSPSGSIFGCLSESTIAECLYRRTSSGVMEKPCLDRNVNNDFDPWDLSNQTPFANGIGVIALLGLAA